MNERVVPGLTCISIGLETAQKAVKVGVDKRAEELLTEQTLDSMRSGALPTKDRPAKQSTSAVAIMNVRPIQVKPPPPTPALSSESSRRRSGLFVIPFANLSAPVWLDTVGSWVGRSGQLRDPVQECVAKAVEALRGCVEG